MPSNVRMNHDLIQSMDAHQTDHPSAPTMSSAAVSTSKKHIVVIAYEAWGHTRPLCVLAARIVKLHAVNITFFTTQNFYDRVNIELMRSFTPEEAHFRDFIRVVGLINDGLTPLDTATLDADFAEAYNKLIARKPLVCTHSNTTYEPLDLPLAIVIDFFCVTPINAIRAAGHPIKIYAWWTGATNSIFRLWGPEKLGGRGDIVAKLEAEARLTGKPIAEIADDFVLSVDGSVIHTPGLPPMYDHEYFPQQTPHFPGLGNMMMTTSGALRMCDGILLSTPERYEREAVEGVREWYAETSRSVYVCGPLLPPVSTNKEDNSEKGAAIVKFLDTTLETHGPNSLLYLSFGTVWWPVDSQKVWVFIDVLLEMKIPFIMSHASRFAVIPEEVTQKVQASGLGLLSPWSPQQTILAHPATGWFVTHGGHNSVIESVSYGVPMICWPFTADQPANAVHLTDKLQVAYELIEVRTGERGLKPIYRTSRVPKGTSEAVREEARDVLTKAFGEDGKQKRANIERLQYELKQAWEEGGPSQRAIADLINSL